MHKLEMMLVPYKATNRKVRYGPREDAGYVVIDGVFSSSMPLITFGVGDNIDFEIEVGEKHKSSVICYDQEPQGHFCRQYPVFCSSPIGSEHKLTEQVTYKKLHASKENISQILPKEGEYVLKMDIEGAEWDVIRNIPEEAMPRMVMLVVEYHLGQKYRETGSIDELEDVFVKLNKSHKLVHVHGNNYEPFYINGTRLPSVLECCYVSKLSNLAKDTVDTGDYPIIGIDAPNNRYAVDLPLDWWKTVQ
jgi:hypothetical protein